MKLRRAEDLQSSAQIVASIDDLLTGILLRLPIKSLLRSKLVSKHWHSLITNPQFRLLRNPNPNPAIGLFLLSSFIDFTPSYQYVPFSTKESNNPPFKILKFAQEPRGIIILQSCNGLLLCGSNRARGCKWRYHVYNPTTNRFSTLPKLDDVGRSTRICGLNLAFDPAKSPHYKVVCVRRSELDSGEYELRFEVYSSDTGPWRKCGEQRPVEVDFTKGVYWNGAIHWISNVTANSWYFNLDRQVLEEMPMPPIPDGMERRCNSYFGESCDHLHYAQFFGPQIEFDVYEMKRDYSGWFVKYRVDLSPVVVDFPGIIRDEFDPTDWYCYEFSVFSVVRGQWEADSFLVLQIPGKVIRCNLVSRTFELMYEFEGAETKGCLTFPYTNGFIYIESLCSV